MKVNQYIKYQLKNLKKSGLETPLQEIRYVLREKLNISLEDQIFQDDLALTEYQIFELEKIFEERKKKHVMSMQQ